MQITAQRPSVAADDDRPVLECVSEEISGGEVDIERQIGADECEAAGDDGRDAGFKAELFRGKFPFPVGGDRPARMGFRKSFAFRLLWAVDCPGTCEQHALDAALPAEIDHMACPFHDDGIHLFRIFLFESGTCRGGGVDDLVERRGGEREIPDIALEKTDMRQCGEFREFQKKPLRIPGQDRQLTFRVRLKPPRREQAFSEKTGSCRGDGE